MAVIYFDKSEIIKALNVLKPDNQLYEIRIVNESGSNNIPITGYFRDAEVLVRELAKQDLKGRNVYFTINSLNDSCYSRSNRDCFKALKGSSTSKNDIVGLEWLMIDLDPKRVSKVSSSHEELRQAKILGNKVYKFLQEQGFKEPIVALSGNGVHMLYKVHIKNTTDNENMLKLCLRNLSILFSTEQVEVDTTTFDAPRICKLYGTLAQKGSNTEERPHRMSKLIKSPAEIEITSLECIQNLANYYHEDEKDRKERYSYRGQSDFDLDTWLDKYSIGYTKASYQSGTKYILDHCPFDSSHTGKDASIFRFSDGSLGFHCFHNSCQGKTWHDVRMVYEPDAYEHKRKEEYKQTYLTHNRDYEPPKPPAPREDNDASNPIFETAKYILKKPKQPCRYIKSGIDAFDKKYRGLRTRGVTILSGYTGGAKSTLLSQIILNAVDTGSRVVTFSGELHDDDFMDWMNLQASGKSHVKQTENMNFYYVPSDIAMNIADWLEDKFWLYNNDYGYNFRQIYEDITSAITKYRIDLVCIDNLMAMDISDVDTDLYKAQKKFVWDLHMLAMRMDIHIIVVAHPKKSHGLLTKFDISGSSDIINAVDNIIFCYRVNQEFKRDYAEFFGGDCSNALGINATNTITVAKVRFGSVDDSYYPLFYENETKRLRNTEHDNRIYGWDVNNNGFEAIQEEFEIPFD